MWSRQTPLMVTAATEHLTLEVGGLPAKTAVVRLQRSLQRGDLVPLRDDALNGDKLAGDGVFTVRLLADELRQALTDQHMHRLDLGVLRLGGDVSPPRRDDLLIACNVWGRDFPAANLRPLSANAQVASHLLNLRDGKLLARLSAAPLGSAEQRRCHAELCRQVYTYVHDEYDFINFVYAIDLAQKPHHFQVRNSVRGIGLEQFDFGEIYHSPRRLLGISVFPQAARFDGASRNYLHELGHQWINQLRLPQLEQTGSHWPLSDLAAGVMGYSAGRLPLELRPSGNEFVFEASDAAKRFTDLDLYLMGLLPIEEVRPHAVLVNQEIAPRPGLKTGPVQWITPEMIVARHGSRVPGFKDSPQSFRLATVVVSEELLTGEEMAFFNFFSARAESELELPVHPREGPGTALPFFRATGGRGRLITRIAPR